ncbi:MAG: ABC transporter substrate-binding protein [Ectothiorhodospiraceae bacterium]|nr:ABC transporter substrate-binding protein [Ectothiorhodospiraceae bacterium]
MKLIRSLAQTLPVAAAVVSASASAGISNGEVRLGFLTDFNSIYADSAGQGSLIAAEMAIDEFGGEVLGAPIRIYPVDHRLNPDHALAEAERLRTEYNIDALVEMVGTNVAVPLQRYAREHNIAALHVGTASSELTNTHCSPVGVHWAYDTHALAAGTANAMINRGAETFYFVTVDYAFGHTMEADARRTIERQGGTVRGRALHEFRASDGSEALLEAEAAGADVIALANAGGDHRTTVRQAYEFGILGGNSEVVALLTAINNVQQLGMYVSEGLIFTTGFYWNYDEETRAFSRRFVERHGSIPNMLQAGTYSAVLHYLKGIERAGTDEAQAVMAAMRELPVNDAFARNGYLREDGRMVHDMYLVEVKSPTEQDERWDYLRVLDVIPGDDAYRPLEESQCELVR